MATQTPTTPGTRPGVRIPSRRELISTAGFTALAGIAAVAIAKPDAPAVEILPTPHPDAKLIAECKRFLELERQTRANFETLGEDDDVVDAANNPLVFEQDEILRRMRDLHATTSEGFRLRAQALFEFSPEIAAEGGPDTYWDNQLAWLLVRDLIAAGVA